MTEAEEFEVYRSAGDLQIASVLENNPFGDGEYEIRFSKQGVKKSLTFEAPEVDELEEIFRELQEEAELELIYECTQCGQRYSTDSPGSPYKCECGSRKFELVDGFDTVDKKTGKILISVYLDDDILKLEIADKSSKKAEIFEDTNGKYEEAAEVFKEIQEKYEEYKENSRTR